MSRSGASRVDSPHAGKNNARSTRRHAGKLASRESLSREAKQRAAAILEVLGGLRTPTDAARALSISLPRYYLLEQTALEGLVKACEPRNRGPRASPGKQLARLERELERLRRDSARQQALLRAAQRTMGLAPPAPIKPEAKVPGRRRKRKPTARALKAAAALQSEAWPLASGGASAQTIAAS